MSKSLHSLFTDWFSKKAEKKVFKIEKKWIKDNEPNEDPDEPGGDHWHVNQFMHAGEAYDMTWANAKEAFLAGANGEEWEMTWSNSLLCDLNEVILDAYEAGKLLSKK